MNTDSNGPANPPSSEITEAQVVAWFAARHAEVAALVPDKYASISLEVRGQASVRNIDWSLFTGSTDGRVCRTFAEAFASHARHVLTPAEIARNRVRSLEQELADARRLADGIATGCQSTDEVAAAIADGRIGGPGEAQSFIQTEIK